MPEKQIPAWHDLPPRFKAITSAWDEPSRRHFLTLMGASFALMGLTGCEARPAAKIVPYTTDAALAPPGTPIHYATALTQDGIANGVLVTTIDGRPIKIEGNPDHPFSRGGTDPFLQAAILQLYDMDRSDGVRHLGRLVGWEAFQAAMVQRLAMHKANAGEGLYLLTGSLTSPSLIAQIEALLAAMPKARWHSHASIGREAIYRGTRAAFGQPLETLHRFDRARVIVALDGDFLDGGPQQVGYSRDWMTNRRAAEASGATAALYAAATTPSLTSAKADARVYLSPAETAMLAAALDGGSAPAVLSDTAQAWLARAKTALNTAGGDAVVTVGAYAAPELHAAAHRLNQRLGAIGSTVFFTQPVVARGGDDTASLAALCEAMRSGAVKTLLILGANPAYDAPADLGFAAALPKVEFAMHAGLYHDETAALCQWHAPLAHPLESWGDARALDGTASLVQPLIRPLFGGKSIPEMLSLLSDENPREGLDLLQTYWRQHLNGDFDSTWREALVAGFIPNTASPTVTPPAPLPSSPTTSPANNSDALDIIFRPDPTVWDGSVVNNPWLQELPKPLTKSVWENIIAIPASLAAAQQIETGDEVEIKAGQAILRGPAWILPGQPARSITLYMGYGRRRAGTVGNAIGYDANALRAYQTPWLRRDGSLRKTGARRHLAFTDEHHDLGDDDRSRIAKVLGEREQVADHPTLYKTWPGDGRAWGMVIDLDSCIGCNACVTACQAENNIPTVGKEQVIMGRAMHWLRVDRYYTGSDVQPATYFQPVPCMHCEDAPCEIGCPVGATVHDSEGLNAMVYNRCVGTRTCSAYCPYKVRHFNFLDYTGNASEGVEAQRNPQVTVRGRGVMEKCTYCVQRISVARIAADKENRPIDDGEVVTACQGACPTQAITFGNLADPRSRVAAARQRPRHYALLGELNTRPRTTYLAARDQADDTEPSG
jgi:Fe-S-cluster-containing dehydrogenase component/anaerobic selenocysteine-containing dehydrogenase